MAYSIERREVNAAAPRNVQLQVHLHGATMGGEGELEWSPQTSKMSGNAEFKVCFLWAQPLNNNPVNDNDSFKDQLQKKFCYNLNSGLLFPFLKKQKHPNKQQTCNKTKPNNPKQTTKKTPETTNRSEFPPDPLIELITSPWTISQMHQDLISEWYPDENPSLVTQSISSCEVDLYSRCSPCEKILVFHLLIDPTDVAFQECRSQIRFGALWSYRRCALCMCFSSRWDAAEILIKQTGVDLDLGAVWPWLASLESWVEFEDIVCLSMASLKQEKDP